jgi:hypothetical protein
MGRYKTKESMSHSFKLFLFLVSFQCFAGTLTFKEVSKNEYELILKNETSLEIAQAQQAIYDSAVKICKGMNPIYGKYKFESQEPISEDGETSSFTFVQNITCSDEVQSTPSRSKFEISKNQEIEIKKFVSEMTNKFIQSKEEGSFKVAYNMMAHSMKKISDFNSWKKKELDYLTESGNLINRDVWRLTIYNNPDNSPSPGVYIAADYESSYDNHPVHCGYIMWFASNPNSKEYKVIREEAGNIPNDAMKNIKPENLQNIRKQIGCRAL